VLDTRVPRRREDETHVAEHSINHGPFTSNMSPVGTPAEVVDTLATDIGHVLAEPNTGDWIAEHGGEPIPMTQPEFERCVLSESESAARIVPPIESSSSWPLSSHGTDRWRIGSLHLGVCADALSPRVRVCAEGCARFARGRC
jgi:hypothetical protein